MDNFSDSNPANLSGWNLFFSSRERRRHLRRWSNALAAALLYFGAPRIGYGAVAFIQLTDPHLFESKKRQAQDSENRAAFKACVAKINDLNSTLQLTNRSGFQFVVVTGDLGIEELNPTNRAAQWQDAITTVADLIHPSTITNWLFVPGNNDLETENPDTIWKYHRFLGELKTRLLGLGIQQVTDLCPPGDNLSHAVAATYQVGPYCFLGFNDASFKSNDSGKDARRFQAAQLDCVAQVAQRLTNQWIGIFYHIPDIENPFWASDASPDALHQLRWEKGMAGDPRLNSAWTVAADVRLAWDQVVTNSNVKALMAGHFHSAQREVYRNFSWMKEQGYESVAADNRKLFVCPPIACKYQNDSELQARGFRTYTIDNNGRISSDIVWYGFRNDSDIPAAARRSDR